MMMLMMMAYDGHAPASYTATPALQGWL